MLLRDDQWKRIEKLMQGKVPSLAYTSFNSPTISGVSISKLFAKSVTIILKQPVTINLK
jgi:hypothetical protein